jgi:hypothetical protein
MTCRLVIALANVSDECPVQLVIALAGVLDNRRPVKLTFRSLACSSTISL